jgi:hypothetical protein
LVQQPDSLPAQTITLPVELVIRDSTAPPKNVNRKDYSTGLSKRHQ